MKKYLDIMRIPATILGGLGLIYSIYIHINAIDYADIIDGNRIPSYLDFVMFIVWIIAIAIAIYRQKELSVEKSNFLAKLKVFYKTMFGETPTFMIIISTATFIYGTYYGWLNNFSFEGVAGIIDGKLVLHNHGQIIRELTETEFLEYKAGEIKTSTANSILFYGVGTGILFPRLSKIE